MEEFNGLIFDEDVLLLEPRERYDSCVIGKCAQTGKAVYSADKIISVLMENMGSGEDEEITEDNAYNMALEYFDFNILGSYVGEMTPLYVWGTCHPEESSSLLIQAL